MTVAELADYAASRGVRVPVPPMLSVLLLGNPAWATPPDWDRGWVGPAFEQGYFVSTDEWQGETVGRMCLVHPDVDSESLRFLVDLAASTG